MKTGMKKAADVVVTILLLGVGCWLVYSSWFDTATTDKVFEVIKNSPFFISIIGLILVLSVLLRLSASGKQKDKHAFINFHSEDGSVGISTKAICDFIERVGKEFTAIKSIDSKLIKAKDAVDIALDVKVVSGNKIPELSHVLQQRVRESVRESLGLEEIRNITIKVQEIVGDPAKPAPEEAPAAK